MTKTEIAARLQDFVTAYQTLYDFLANKLDAVDMAKFCRLNKLVAQCETRYRETAFK